MTSSQGRTDRSLGRRFPDARASGSSEHTKKGGHYDGLHETRSQLSWSSRDYHHGYSAKTSGTVYRRPPPLAREPGLRSGRVSSALLRPDMTSPLNRRARRILQIQIPQTSARDTFRKEARQ